MLLAKWVGAYDDSRAKSMIDEGSSGKEFLAFAFQPKHLDT
jgi:hypothetical protein